MLHLRCRQVPTALVAAVGSLAVLWSLSQATDNPRVSASLGLLAVVAATAAAGSGLAGKDIDLDRTAAIAWVPRRAAHVIVIVAAVTGIVAATALTGDQLAPAAQITRDAAGMAGLLALGAVTLGASRAWIAPLTWTLLAQTLQDLHWPAPSGSTVQAVITWIVQSPATTSATITAVAVGTAGALTYAIFGPRP